MMMEKIAKQMIDFQKTTFDNAFSAGVMLQDQAEQVFSTAIEQTVWLPEEGKRAIDQWLQTLKAGRRDFKEIVDDSFENAAEFLTPAAPAARPQPAKAAAEATSAKTK